MAPLSTARLRRRDLIQRVSACSFSALGATAVRSPDDVGSLETNSCRGAQQKRKLGRCTLSMSPRKDAAAILPLRKHAVLEKMRSGHVGKRSADWTAVPPSTTSAPFLTATSKNSLRSSLAFYQHFSSWANAAVSDDEEEGSDGDDGTAEDCSVGASHLDKSESTTTTTTGDRHGNETPQRPRLAALREHLQAESTSGVVELASVTNVVHNTQETKDRNGQANNTNGTTSSSATSTTVEELRRWVRTLPDIAESSHVLRDRFQRQHTYLRLSLTERCNLRCTYCMPENGVPLQPPSHLLQTAELLQLASYFREQGVTKFRLTGGEPTLRRDLTEIVQGLQTLNPKQIGMTTNGIVLAPKLPELVDAGLSSVNLSLDTLQEDKFARLTRRPGKYLTKVWQALEACQELLASKPGHSFKLNCVVMRDENTDEIADFVRLTQDFPGLAVRFIEYMPFTENGWNDQQLVPYQELLQQLRQESGIDLTPIPSDDPSDTTKWYQAPWNHEARIGFITSMTHHFCGTCNRLRLTADGQLKVCLFDGKTELSLRDAMRAGFTNEELSKVIHAAVQQKHYKLGGHISPNALAADVDTNRPMTLIGG